jgi:DNA adenine methylase
VILQHDSPLTLHYVDPPYMRITRSPHTLRANKGYRHEMGNEDHRALAQVLRSVTGMVILSGYACDLYDRELYADWHRVERQALADGARKRTEVLWVSPNACGHPATLFAEDHT